MEQSRLTDLVFQKNFNKPQSLKVQKTMIILIYYHHTGETLTTTMHNNEITCMKWHDKRVVNMLSTYHGNEMIEKERNRKVGGTEKVKKP